MRTKSFNSDADSIVSAQMIGSTLEQPGVLSGSLQSVSGAAGSLPRQIGTKRSSFSSSVGLTARLSPSRHQSFQDKLFCEDFQQKTKLQFQKERMSVEGSNESVVQGIEKVFVPLAAAELSKMTKDQRKAYHMERRQHEKQQDVPQQKRRQASLTPKGSTAEISRVTSPSNTQPAIVVRVNAQMRFDDSKVRAKAEKAAGRDRKVAQKPVGLFAHLPQFEPYTGVLTEHKTRSLIHPAVLRLGLHFSQFIISGGNARCMAMLQTFQRVVCDYNTPQGTSLQRHLTTHISKQVDFLSTTRSLCATMKTAIRFLKQQISTLSIDMPDEDAKALLCETIDDFIRDRIVYADNLIVREVLSADKIKDGDVILTYACSSVVLQLLLEAHKLQIDFRVIVVDGRPKLEGKTMLRRLVSVGIKCTYILTNGLNYVIKEATKAIIGASAVLSDGAIMSRAGTALVAMAASDAKVPVMVLCETLKFSASVRLDSFVWNEIGDPDDLVDISGQSSADKLPPVIPALHKTRSKQGAAHGWRDKRSLKLLNLFYDVTPAKFVTMVVCELGQIPSNAVMTVLRDAAHAELGGNNAR